MPFVKALYFIHIAEALKCLLSKNSILYILQKHANPTIRNLNEESALDLAAQYGRLEVVQLLLTLYPDLSQRPACTQSTVHLASRNGHKEIVEVLLNSNFDVQTVVCETLTLNLPTIRGFNGLWKEPFKTLWKKE